EHAHAEAEVLTARNVLDLLLARGDRLVSIAINANICIGHAELPCQVDGDVRQRILIDAIRCLLLSSSNITNPGGQGSKRQRTGRNPGRLDKVTTRGGHCRASFGWNFYWRDDLMPQKAQKKQGTSD